ncbi:MAG: hypothetical protein ACOC1O_00600 [bacterium]
MHLKDNKHKKDMLKAAGFDKEVENVEKNLCPFCNEKVNESEFENDLSRREFEISGMCQRCQTKIFGE